MASRRDRGRRAGTKRPECRATARAGRRRRVRVGRVGVAGRRRDGARAARRGSQHGRRPPRPRPNRARVARRRESRCAAGCAAVRRGARGRRGHRERGRDRAPVSAPPLVRRHHRLERQDHDDGAHGPTAHRARPARVDGGEHRHAPLRAGGLEDAAGMGRARDLLVPVARYAVDRSHGRRAHEPLGEPSRPVRRRRRVLRRQDADVQERQADVELGHQRRRCRLGASHGGHRRAPLSVLGAGGGARRRTWIARTRC